MRANFVAAVVYNVESDHLVPMGGDDDDTVPSAFIGASVNINLNNFCLPTLLSRTPN